MEQLLAAIRTEFETFMTNASQQSKKGCKKAGQRARKASLMLGKHLKEYRAESLKYTIS